MSYAMTMNCKAMTNFRSRHGTWMVTVPMEFRLPPMSCTDPPITDHKVHRKQNESPYAAYCPWDIMERRLADVPRRIPRIWSYGFLTRCECTYLSAMGFVSERMRTCRKDALDWIYSISIRSAAAMKARELASVVSRSPYSAHCAMKTSAFSSPSYLLTLRFSKR